MKKLLKKIVSAAVAVSAISVIMINVYAAICPPHQYGENVETLVNQYSVGSHSHVIGYDTSGKPIAVICYMTVKEYRGGSRCLKCGQVGNTYVYNVTEHSALT